MYNESTYPQPGYTSGYGTAATNNPFLESSESNAAIRWPDISSGIGQPSHLPWQSTQTQPNSSGNSLMSPDVFPGGGNNLKIGPPNPPGFQPPPPQIPINSNYFQMLSRAQHTQAPSGPPTTSPMSYQPNSMTSFQQNQGYPQYNQYTGLDTGGYANPNVSQFDPMMNSGLQTQTGFQPNTSQISYDQSLQNANYQVPTQYSTNSYNLTPSTNAQQQQLVHPRDYIQNNKAHLERWDQYHWRQALNAFDTLEEAWRKRASELEQMRSRIGYVDHNLETMIRTARANLDATATCNLQMKEVSSNYRHSIDASSRDRVREALNAGLRELPSWPQ